LFAGTYRTSLGLSRTFLLPDPPRSFELQLQGDDLVEIFLIFPQSVFGLEPATVRVREVRIGRAERRAARRRARENRLELTGMDPEGPALGDEETPVNVRVGVTLTAATTPIPQGLEDAPRTPPISRQISESNITPSETSIRSPPPDSTKNWASSPPPRWLHTRRSSSCRLHPNSPLLRSQTTSSYLPHIYLSWNIVLSTSQRLKEQITWIWQMFSSRLQVFLSHLSCLPPSGITVTQRAMFKVHGRRLSCKRGTRMVFCPLTYPFEEKRRSNMYCLKTFGHRVLTLPIRSVSLHHL